MNYDRKICSFTGHRTQKLREIFTNPVEMFPLLTRIVENEIERFILGGFETFQTGMAIGADIMFAEAVLRRKNDYPRTRLIAVIPCRGQESKWSEANKNRYYRILERADKVEMVSDRPYYDGCMMVRNRRLVDTCDELLAVYDGQYGGTKATVDYAKKLNKTVTVIDPGRFVRLTLFG